MENQTISPFITIKAACKLLRVGRTKFNELLNSDEIQSFTKNDAYLKSKRWIVTESCLDYLISKDVIPEVSIAQLPPVMSVADIQQLFCIGKSKSYEFINTGLFKSHGIGGDTARCNNRIVYTESILDYLMQEWRKRGIQIYQPNDEISLIELVEKLPISRTKSLRLIKEKILVKTSKVPRNRIRVPIKIDTQSILEYFHYTPCLSGC